MLIGIHSRITEGKRVWFIEKGGLLDSSLWGTVVSHVATPFTLFTWCAGARLFPWEFPEDK